MVSHNALYSYCLSQPCYFPHIHCVSVLLESIEDFPVSEHLKTVLLHSLFFTTLD